MPGRAALLLFPLAVAAAEPGPAPHEVRLDRHGHLLPPGAVARLGASPALAGLPNDLAWSADGTRFLTADWQTITAFDAATGRPVESRVLDTAIRNRFTPLSRDGRSLFRQMGGHCWLTDADSGEPILDFYLPRVPGSADHGGLPGRSLTISADARFLAGVLADGIDPGVPWRFDLAKRQYSRIADRTDVMSVSLAPDGKRAFGVIDGQAPRLAAWDLAGGKELWAVPSDGPRTVRAVSPDGRRVAAVGLGTVRVFDARGAEVFRTAYELDRYAGLRPLDFSADGKLLALAGPDGVAVWDVETGRVRHRMSDAAHLVAFAPDGRSLLTAGHWVQKWDLATGKPAYPVSVAPRPMAPSALQWSADGRRLLAHWPGDRSGDRDDRRPDALAVWDVRTTEVLWRHRTDPAVLAAHLDRVRATVRLVTADSRLHTRCTGPGDKATAVPLPHEFVIGLQVWFPANDRVAVRVPCEAGVVTSVADRDGVLVYRQVVPRPAVGPGLDPNPVADGGTLFVADGRRTDLLTGRARPALDGNPSVREVLLLVAADGPFVAGWVGSEMGVSGFVWESATGWQIAPIPKPPGDGSVAALSPTGRLLAQADRNHVVLHDLFDHSNYCLPAAGARSLAFSPDGRLLATGRADSTILVWEVPALRPATADPKGRWTSLSSVAGQAWPVLWYLLDHPAEAVELLDGRLNPVPVARDPAGPITRLDHPRYSVREAASRELAGLGEVVEGDLLAAIKAPASEEQRARLEGLLARLDPAARPEPETCRALRCI